MVKENNFMNQQILDYIKSERVGVLAVKMPDGSPHAATVHYSHTENPLRLFVQTTNTTLKVKSFLGGETEKVAFVIGFSEEEWKTLQLHGIARAVSDPKELEDIYKIHYAKNPDAEQYKGPKTIFLEITPTWWRYTDYNTDPETIIEK